MSDTGETEVSVSTEELAALLGRPDVRVVDVRSDLDDPTAGERAYEREHLPGAVYLDWVRDLSDPDDPVEGQIAPPARFAAAMSAAGIGDGTLVVPYDDSVLFTAARLAWCLRYYGHDAVRVLDGGFPRWAAEGRALTDGRPEVAAATFTPRPRPELRRTKEEVLALLEEGTKLLDCRMDRTWEDSGAHIPGARRFPAPGLLDDDGTMRSAERVRALAAEAGVAPEDPVVLYCGGGVSASQAFLALKRAGFERASVYDGSWGEWGEDPTTPKEPHDGDG